MSRSPLEKVRVARSEVSPEGEEAPGGAGQRAVALDALALDAELRQALVTVRSLGSRGLRVAALATSRGLPTFSSRWCQQAVVCPTDEGTDAYLSFLEQWLDHTPAGVLIPSSDGTVDLLRRYRARLEQRARVALAREPALATAINKEQTLALAQQLGLAIPRGIAVASEAEVADALREIGLPAVVKPVESWVRGELRGARLVSELVTTTEEARRAVEGMILEGGTTLFQQFLPGRREAVSFLHAHGQIYARFAQWAKRVQPPLGGQSVLRQSIGVPTDIGEQAERLIREMDLEGYAEVEFRRDSLGKPYLMEINPRLSASVEIAVRSGVDFPYLLYQWARGEPISRVTHYHTGGWMRFLGGDLVTTVQALKQRGRPGVTPPARAIGEFCLSFFVPMNYDYVDWRDPVPAVKATTNFARFLLPWLKGKLSRRRYH